jgi:hypothetical protein
MNPSIGYVNTTAVTQTSGNPMATRLVLTSLIPERNSCDFTVSCRSEQEDKDDCDDVDLDDLMESLQCKIGKAIQDEIERSLRDRI